MAKYIVGPNKDTWDFLPAVNDANPGDTIMLQPDLNINIGKIDISKNLTIVGNVSSEGNGNVHYHNTLYGAIAVKSQANVTLKNIWISCGESERNIIWGSDQVTVNLDHVVIESTKTETNDYPIIYADANSTVNFTSVVVRENVNASLATYFKDCKVNIKDSTFKKCRVVCENTELTVSDCSLNYKEGEEKTNALYLNDCVADIDNTTIIGANVENFYPAVCAIKSRISSKNMRVIQNEYNSAVILKLNSFLDSQDDNVTSLWVDDSRSVLKDIVIDEILCLNNNASALVNGRVNILGENESSIDIYANDHSIIYGDGIKLHRIAAPNVRMIDNSVVHLKCMEYEDGDISDLKFEIDETSDCHYASKSDANAHEGSQTDTEKLSAREQLDQLIGLKSVKREIDKMIRMLEFNQQRIAKGLEPQEQSFHSVFMGNPGTGKTTVARLIGEVLCESGAFNGDNFKLIEASEPDFISQNVGETPQKTLKLLESAKGGVLFIDEAYALNKKDASVNFGIEAINTILKYMEDHRGEIMVIFAGYTKEMEQFLRTNPGLTSRVPNKFVFEDYTPDEIAEIGISELLNKQYNFENKEYYEQQVKRAYHNTLDRSNARWIRNFNEKLLKAFAERVMSSGCEDLETICNVDIDEVLNQGKYQAEDQNKEDALEQLQNLIGITQVKEQVQNFISLVELNHKREEQGQKNGDFTLHSLFLGNPGTGKTTVARIVGEILYQKGIIGQRKFIETSRSNLVAGYKGQTALKTKEVLESALGGVLFIDEAYALYQDNDEFGLEAIDEILKFMEDHRKDIVIILAGYTKEMGEFMQANSGLVSRVPHTFNFEDYTPDEIVEIGLLGLHSAGYQIDEDYYASVVKDSYLAAADHSNGRWVRNFNEKLVMTMSRRVSKSENADINTILNEDLNQISAYSATGAREIDEDGFVRPR